MASFQHTDLKTGQGAAAEGRTPPPGMRVCQKGPGKRFSPSSFPLLLVVLIKTCCSWSNIGGCFIKRLLFTEI